MDLKGVVGNVTLEGCVISNASSAGIIFEGCSGDTAIRGCEVSGCKFDGLGLHMLKGKASHRGSVTISDSKFLRNGYDGLYLGDPRFSVKLLRCHVAGNDRHGVCIRGSECDAQETLEACTIEENSQEAIHSEAFVARERPSSGWSSGSAQGQKAHEVDGKGLPEGWRSFKNAEGLTYYYDCATGAVQWSHPSHNAECAPSAPPALEGGLERARAVRLRAVAQSSKRRPKDKKQAPNADRTRALISEGGCAASGEGGKGGAPAEAPRRKRVSRLE